jgi:hypothetical protein
MIAQFLAHTLLPPALLPSLPLPCLPSLSAGLQAIAQVAASIRAGFYTVGIAGGVESMTTNPMAWEGAINPRVTESQSAQDCLLPMGEWAHGWGVGLAACFGRESGFYI